MASLIFNWKRVEAESRILKQSSNNILDRRKQILPYCFGNVAYAQVKTSPSIINFKYSVNKLIIILGLVFTWT